MLHKCKCLQVPIVWALKSRAVALTEAKIGRCYMSFGKLKYSPEINMFYYKAGGKLGTIWNKTSFRKRLLKLKQR
jgi:hypothetical protein